MGEGGPERGGPDEGAAEKAEVEEGGGPPYRLGLGGPCRKGGGPRGLPVGDEFGEPRGEAPGDAVEG